jgi:hypothetical protein
MNPFSVSKRLTLRVAAMHAGIGVIAGCVFSILSGMPPLFILLGALFGAIALLTSYVHVTYLGELLNRDSQDRSDAREGD